MSAPLILAGCSDSSDEVAELQAQVAELQAQANPTTTLLTSTTRAPSTTRGVLNPACSLGGLGADLLDRWDFEVRIIFDFYEEGINDVAAAIGPEIAWVTAVWDTLVGVYLEMVELEECLQGEELEVFSRFPAIEIHTEVLLYRIGLDIDRLATRELAYQNLKRVWADAVVVLCDVERMTGRSIRGADNC